MAEGNEGRFVGEIPHYYQTGLGPVLFTDFAHQMAQDVAAHSPATLLETAAGTGIVTEALRAAMPGATIVATDLNEPMLQEARTRLGQDGRLTIAAADAQSLPYADSSFDALVCQFGMMFFPDKLRSYAEARRVLRPGGHYHVSVWDSHAHNGFARITDELIRSVFPANPPTFYAVPFSCAAMDPIKAGLDQAGFVEIAASVRHIDKVVVDLPLFARGLLFGNPVVDQLRARGASLPEELHGQLVDRLAAAFGTSPAIVPLQTIFWSAMRPADA